MLGTNAKPGEYKISDSTAMDVVTDNIEPGIGFQQYIAHGRLHLPVAAMILV